MHVTKQVCVQRRQSAESVALPAFAAAPPDVQQSIDIPARRAHSSKPAARPAEADEWDRQTDERRTVT